MKLLFTVDLQQPLLIIPRNSQSSEALVVNLGHVHLNNQFSESNGSVLDNTMILYGSGASTTHKNVNLPTLIAGGANMGLKHGQYTKGRNRMTNLFLSMLHSMGIEEESFGDSQGTLSDSIFSV